MTNWVADLVESSLVDPGSRVVATVCDEIDVDGIRLGRIQLTFTVEDFRGETYEAKGRILLPLSLRDDPTAQLPLVVHCGYESNEAHSAKQVARGRVSATTVQLPLDAVFPNSWSLLRGPKMEFVLSHLARALPFVDPTKVVYSGGSAGGYSALMVAAEAFPVAAATPGVPPVNLAYMGALWASNLARVSGTDAPALGWLQGLEPAVAAWRQVFGEDYDAPAWTDHSPSGQVERITGPVCAFFSSADVLVPIAQVDRELAKPVVTSRAGDVEYEPEAVTAAQAAHVRLLDVLGERADVRVVPVPDDAVPMLTADLTLTTDMPPFDMPEAEPVAGRWAITVADEGEPVWLISHFKHQYEPDFEPFIARALQVELSVDQLTAPKLDQLLDRYRGAEWLSAGFHHLDHPEAEVHDVELGLRAYCATSSAHRERFRVLYAAVPEENRVLPSSLVGDLLS